jgi:molybdopterin-synthase adenylyltransferase
MKTDLEVRLIGADDLRCAFARPSARERVFIALATISSPTRSLIIRDAVEVPGIAFFDGVEAAWSHRFTMEQVGRATAAGTGICILHSHGGRGQPGLSVPDKENFWALAPSVQSLHPEMLVASVVFSGDWHASGIVLPGNGGRALTVNRARWYGAYIDVQPGPPALPLSWRRGARHLPVWGKLGEERVRAARIGVVGLGGGGSHVVQQFSHVAVGTLAGVDADVLEDHNRSRVVGTIAGDIGKKKLRAMKRLARDASDGHTAFMGIDAIFPTPEALEVLATCDVIVGCVDKLSTRKLLQEFAWQHAIPLVDIGLTIDPTAVPCRPAVGGQVFIGVPGGPCMWCAGILTQAGLGAETDEQGYVRGGGEAQVVSLNGSLASQAVTEVLNLLTGFMSAPGVLPPAKLVFDGRHVRAIEVSKKPDCQTCRSMGSGDVIWQRAA